jgi:hypothetical protein
MTSSNDRPPQHHRAERLKAALRENLRRRKAQAKGRARDPAVERADSPPNSAGIAGEDTKD